MRVFLDTNVLVSAFTTRGICADLLAVVLAEHELFIGEPVLDELRRILRQKMKMPRSIIDDADSFLRLEATVVSATAAADLSVVRDPDDREIIAQALAGGAEVLVTGDRDLLDVAEELSIEVLSPRGFWQKLRRQR